MSGKPEHPNETGENIQTCNTEWHPWSTQGSDPELLDSANSANHYTTMLNMEHLTKY